MPRTFLILVLAGILSACAGTATETSPTGDDATAAASESEKPKMRCYREKSTESRIGGKRICKPVSE